EPDELLVYGRIGAWIAEAGGGEAEGERVLDLADPGPRRVGSQSLAEELNDHRGVRRIRLDASLGAEALEPFEMSTDGDGPCRCQGGRIEAPSGKHGPPQRRVLDVRGHYRAPNVRRARALVLGGGVREPGEEVRAADGRQGPLHLLARVLLAQSHEMVRVCRDGPRRGRTGRQST